MRDWQLAPEHDSALPAATDGILRWRPFTGNCSRLVERGEHLAFAVSPGNGYFSEDRLVRMIRWGCARFRAVDLLTADVPMAACTYLGRGYDEGHARRRAKRDVRQMENRIARALARAELQGTPVRVRYLDHAVGQPGYRRIRAGLAQARRENPAFEATCRRMVLDVLTARMPEGWQPDPAQLAAGAEYLDIELPWFADTPGVLGVTESVVAYRVVPAFAPYLYPPGGASPDHQGFMLVDAPDEVSPPGEAKPSCGIGEP
ncbi:tRNA-dependent cyclodipeptide synthase [Amycolatopsis rubida]|uniref:Cyclodipeptide synthase n=1 Tax=Amycolatopsis rubida TaxID=112413 RepID=A0A1I5VKJ8_9PSEU|nr:MULTISPECIES: tRNA-dependent cyclodipeptide synthase [Amycolatopsis]MYW93784.1 tRNA-dependent cyclodipeptide synthase [Amycolatopsis rubida]NEC58773.1 tRNA-dependent cyclodipeptide synthase [Amycolatopsis rubida]OAP22971.1 Cyclo(L-tyrosyl-L-tyrosyl) synthase [Amycolatopsis sp. M39]SFQ08009.1 cyclo(L-tyrosyl-L-tyrosyl) synthase [Amycolatopsis rubida]